MECHKHFRENAEKLRLCLKRRLASNCGGLSAKTFKLTGDVPYGDVSSFILTLTTVADANPNEVSLETKPKN